MNHEDIITTSEFVRNAKMFLDKAKTQPVYIRRGLEVFKVESVKTTFKVDEASDPRKEVVNPPVLNGMSHDEFRAADHPTLDEIVADSVEKPCCKKKPPCSHWSFNGDTSTWLNGLSGRVVEVNT